MKIHSQGTVERNTVAVEAAAKAIHATQPDAVVMVSAYTSIAAFVRQMQKLGSGATFYNVSFVGSKALADALGKDGIGVAISQVVPFPVGHRGAGGQGVPGRGQEGRLHRLQLQRAGGVPQRQGAGGGPQAHRQDLNREKFVDTMEKMDVDLGGFHVAYSPKNHAGSKFVDLTIIARDGKFLR